MGLIANIKGQQGSVGPAGPAGPAGPPGPAGTPGSVWHNGHGVPVNSVGSDGDYYLDDTTGDVYVKAGGTWA